MSMAEYGSGRHRPERVEHPERSLQLRGRPSWPLSVHASGRHHVASGPVLAGLHEQTLRTWVPRQRGSGS